MSHPDKVVAIGGSAGSLNIILRIVSELPVNISFSIIIVLHRKNDNDSMLTNLLKTRTRIQVVEAEEKIEIKNGHIYIAPADYHLLIEADHTFSLDASEKINFSRPSIDVVFQSVAEVYTTSLTCILLSGANSDGTAGLQFAKASGAATIVQNPAEAEVAYMPHYAISHTPVDHIFNTNEIISYLNTLG